MKKYPKRLFSSLPLKWDSLKHKTRHILSLFGVIYQKEDILSDFIGLLSGSRLKMVLEIEQNEVFSSLFILASPPPVPGISDLEHNRSRRLQNVPGVCKMSKCHKWDSSCQIYRVTDEALIAETMVWHNFFLMDVFFAIKGSKLLLLQLDAVPCGGRKKSLRTHL